MNLERIFSAPLSELASRGVQEARKALERSRGAVPARGRSQVADAARAFASASAIGSRFFAGALEDATAERIAERCPAARASVLATAARAMSGQFDLLGYRGLDFGAPIDWSFDPVSGRRAPALHWSRIAFLRQEEVGDAKVIWELNRHQWLSTLAQARALSGDEESAEHVLRTLDAWRAANPLSVGINWASSLEVSLRLISWCWSLRLLRRSPALRPERLTAWLASLADHAAHVASYLSRHFSPNTHLTGEALGLFYAGTAFPELRGAARWRDLGASILVEQAPRQILPDGVQFEQATCYQRYTIEIYLHFLILAAASGRSVPAHVGASVERMLDFLLAIRRPDGAMPEIGDADGGWLLPLVPRAPDDPRGVFSLGAAWFGRPDFAWAAGGLQPETLWLLGRAGEVAFDRLLPAPPRHAPSRLFPDGGYAVLQSGWDARAHQLVFDAGPLGCPHSAAHGHADLLSVQCSSFGEPMLVDPGTFSYGGERVWRDRFRSSAFHCTATIDGLAQAEPSALFQWKSRPSARLEAWRSSPGVEWAEGSHDAYASLPAPVRHRRRVLFLQRRCFVVVDLFEGMGAHRVDLHWQFAPLAVRLEPTSWMRAQSSRGTGLLLRSFSAAPVDAELIEPAEDGALGFVSRGYGLRDPAPHLIVSAAAPLPLTIATVLWPIEDAQNDAPAVRLLQSTGEPLLGLEFHDGACRLLFDDGRITVEGRL